MNKKFIQKFVGITLATCCLASTVSLVAACSTLNTSNTGYNVIPAKKAYVSDYNRPMSGAEMDDDIIIDGKFDESFYSKLNWIELNKIDDKQTAEVKLAVRIARKGLLIAADVTENTPITYNPHRPTASDSGLEFYIGFSDGMTIRDGLFEVDMTAGERFGIRRFSTSNYVEMTVAYDTSPYYKVIRNGSIKDGECTGYKFELFLPYSLFGRAGRSDEVYVNPTHIAVLNSEVDSVRNWYNFGKEQSSLYDWGKLFQGFTFDKNGAVYNSLTIAESEGGSVKEEWGYDYCITGDQVNLNVTPNAGYKLSSLKVNGRERVTDVKDGVYSFRASGDTEVVPTFVKA